jgi:hypothetical protein
MRLSGAVTSARPRLCRTFVSIQSASCTMRIELQMPGKRFVIFQLALLEALVSPRLATTCHRTSDLFSQRAQF